MKTLIIDNYDSFTYNLYQYIAELGGNPIVVKNDEISIRQIKEMNPSHIIISPGPGHPKNKKDIGISQELIEKFGDRYPILGVCLGHQIIGAAYGAQIIHAPEPVHGKTSHITHDGTSPIFRNIPKKISVMRYHSLMINKETLPETIKITANTDESDLCMAIEHVTKPIYGVQFHPESISTPYGKKILENFLTIK